MTTLPIDILFDRHRRWYEPGTLERFRAWFERSGYGAMLDNAWLHARGAAPAAVPVGTIKAAEYSGLVFRNGDAPWSIAIATDLSRGADTVEKLFRNFSLCVGHTHPPGDYRNFPAYYTRVHAGPRFLAFDGAGSCLLLGAMIQALAARLLNEKIDLHYSFATDHRLTHVFATWKDSVFVDPDQKTWLPLDKINDAAVYGYVFQQLGVSANALFNELAAEEQNSLFSSMGRAYFDFYRPSSFQYMNEPKQDTADLCAMFNQARADSCTPCSVDASDFAWKDEMRRFTAKYEIPGPYFLVQAEQPVTIVVPPQARLTLGLEMAKLPPEAALLTAIYLGRVPLALDAPLTHGRAELDLPEVPWLLAFAPEAQSVTINGRTFTPRLSRDGCWRILGAGDLEPILGMDQGKERYDIVVVAPGDRVLAVLPFNAFAAASGLMDIAAPEGSGGHVEGRRAT